MTLAWSAMGARVSDLVFHVYTVEKPVTRRFLSVLPQELLGARALPPEGIVGEIRGDPERLTPDTFTANVTFMTLLHWVIASHAAEHPGLQEAAKTQGQGDLLLVDQRTATPANPPSTDVLGVFEVQGGKVERYRVNPEHLLLTDDGLFEIDGFFFDHLLAELRVMLEK